MNRIQTRSPFFVQSSTGVTATLSLFIWVGAKTAPPGVAQYTLTKAHDSAGLATFEIAELSRDYIINNFTGSNDSAAVWVKYTLVDGAGTNSVTTLAVDGYNLWEEGNSVFNTDLWMSSSNEIRIPDAGVVRIPVAGDVNTVKWLSGVTELQSTIYNVVESSVSTDNVKYDSYDLDSNVLLPNIIRLNNGVADVDYKIKYLDCSKWSTYKVTFLNKKGAWEDLYLNARNEENLQISKKEFKVNNFTANLYNGVNTVHNSISKNINAKRVIVLNSGFISENIVPSYESLFLSELAYITDSSRTYPVFLSDNKFEIQNHLNNKLINYKINFDYSFDYMNNIK